MSVKFNEKAIAIFAALQPAEGVSCVNASPTGSISTTVGSATVTGTGTLFSTEIAVGTYLYTTSGAIIGRVLTIASNTSLTLEDVVPAAATVASNGVMAVSTAVSGAAYRTGLGPKNAIRVLNLNYSTELDTEAFRYVGNELDRSEETVVKDKYAKFDCEIFVPALGTIAGAVPTLAEVPLIEIMQSCGMAVVLSTGQVKYTNGLPSNSFITIEIRRSSPDLNLQQKTFTMSDCRGSIDLDAQVGTRAKFKLNYMGNLVDVLDKFTIEPNFGDQEIVHMGSLKGSTITTAQLSLYSGATQPAYVATTKNICSDKLNMPNLSGFDYVRFQTSCGDGWSKEAAPTDISLTIIEDKAAATYNPDNHIEEYHSLYIDYGTVTGFKARIIANKTQLAKVSNSKVASYAGQDLTLRNTGVTDIILL
jgi:hypothetical protein